MRLAPCDGRAYWQKRVDEDAVDDLVVLEAAGEREAELQVSAVVRSWRSCVIRIKSSREWRTKRVDLQEFKIQFLGRKRI